MKERTAVPLMVSTFTLHYWALACLQLSPTSKEKLGGSGRGCIEVIKLKIYHNILLSKVTLYKLYNHCCIIINTNSVVTLQVHFFSLLALVWRSAPLAPLYLKEKKAPRDFIGLNKGAVQAGLTTAQEHFQYRATHDMRRKDSGNEKTSLKVKRIPPTMVFGIPTKYV